MEGSSSSSFPAGFVTLKDLQERWLKRKEEEGEKEKLRKLREDEEIKLRIQKEEREKLRKLREDEEIKLRIQKEEREKLRKLRRDEGMKTRKKKEERMKPRKSRQDEGIGQKEEGEKIRKLREEEDRNLHKLRKEEGIKRSKQKEEEKPPPKDKIRRRFPQNHLSSHIALSSRELSEEHRAENINENPAAVVNATKSEPFDAKSDRPPAIYRSRKGRMRGSSRFGHRSRDPQSAVNVADMKTEKTEKGLKSSEIELTAEIIDRVEKISVAGNDFGRRHGTNSRSGRGYGGFRRGFAIRDTKGMMWVRKTADA